MPDHTQYDAGLVLLFCQRSIQSVPPTSNMRGWTLSNVIPSLSFFTATYPLFPIKYTVPKNTRFFLNTTIFAVYWLLFPQQFILKRHHARSSSFPLTFQHNKYLLICQKPVSLSQNQSKHNAIILYQSK